MFVDLRKEILLGVFQSAEGPTLAYPTKSARHALVLHFTTFISLIVQMLFK